MDTAAIAVNRFGLGRRPWEPAPTDPKGWLKHQLATFDPALAGPPALASRAELAADIADLRDKLKDLKAGQGAPTEAGPSADPKKAMRQETRQFARDQHVAQVGARLRTAVASPTPVAERLVQFYANHFAVSADKLQTIGFSGLLEFEAIRPNLGGRFADMLLAVEQHPAMLLYLDQAQSVGPDSPFGQRAAARGNAQRKVGLNENLGREILELHTLGVRSGYSQADVTELARALTGWTVAGLGRGPAQRLLGYGAKPGDFAFFAPVHEPGERTILGRRYAEAGEAQARSVLTDLARHPATARHLATKLARHFVADDPPPALVARLEKAWLASGGHLPTVHAALVDAPEAWAPVPAKFRDPWRWTVASLRAVSIPQGALPFPLADKAAVGAFQQLGQPVWRPGSPAGWDDIAASWAAPDALLRRVEFAGRLAQGVPPQTDARALAPALFGAGLSQRTAAVLAQAESPKQALALLLAAPEMMRA